MTVKINEYKEFWDSMTPEERDAFMRKVMGSKTRKLEGKEREHMLTVFNLIEPSETSNNQRSFTEEYRHAGKIYYVHYWDKYVEVEEVYLNEES